MKGMKMSIAESAVLHLNAVLVAPHISEAQPKRAFKAFRQALAPLLGEGFSGRWASAGSGPNREEAQSPSPEPLLLLASPENRMKVQVDEQMANISLGTGVPVPSTRTSEAGELPVLGEAWDAFSQVCFLTANVLKEQCNTSIPRMGVVARLKWKKPDNPVALLQNLFFQPGATGEMPEELKIHFRHTVTIGKCVANRWIFLSTVAAKPVPFLELVLDINTPADKSLDLNENQVRLFLANVRKHWSEVDGFLE
jgi:hypothetical protein